MTKRDIYNEGKNRGFRLASWIDFPEIGERIAKHIDWVGLGDEITEENKADYFLCQCGESESNGRQFSPFEFLCRDLNDMEETKPYDVWAEFERGIDAGFRQNWRQRNKVIRNSRRAQKLCFA